MVDSDLPDYEKCETCGTLRHRNPVNPEEIYLDDYWSDKHAHSSLRGQEYNCDVHEENGVSKNQFVINLMPEYSKTLLEIGCAPGSTMNAILRAGKAEEVVGIEVDDSYESEIYEIAEEGGYSVDLQFGFFPEIAEFIKDSYFDTIIGLDVFEHSFTPHPFLLEANRLLNNNGFLLLMLPLVNDDGSILPRMACREHVHLFTKGYMVEMLEQTGFKDIRFSQWCDGHSVVTAIKQ